MIVLAAALAVAVAAVVILAFLLRRESRSLRVVTGIAESYAYGYGPSLSEDAWVKVFYSHIGNPPEREGHAMHEDERRWLESRGVA